ncbi:MAG: hypothetical protein D6715_08130 [Calditrichaeota bacterium]|nr:MAG: hypothetical protein D6715_08130 [Calditrichota bacterium]
MRRLLIVTPVFPETGGRRVEKLVKYLPRFGIEPVVLTSTWQTEIARQVQAREFPETLKIFRVPALPDDPLKLFSRLTGRQALRERLQRLLYLPDFWAHWVPAALLRAHRLLARLNIQVVLTSSPPESVHLVGWWLRRTKRVRWIADFRDLWTQKKQKFNPPTPLHRQLAIRLEQTFLNASNVVVANTPANREIYRRVFGVNSHRVQVIPNGYDPEDAAGETRPDHPDPHSLTLGYLGYLDKDQFPYLPVLEYLQEMRAEGLPVRLEVVGYISPRARSELQRRGMNWVHYTPQMPNFEAVPFLKARSDVLLVLLYDSANSHAIVPLKLYNYLAMDRPILSVGPRGGEVERILQQTRAGCHFAVSEKGAIQQFIRRCWREKQAEGTIPFSADKGTLGKYNIIHLAGKLARIIDQQGAHW